MDKRRNGGPKNTKADEEYLKVKKKKGKENRALTQDLKDASNLECPSSILDISEGYLKKLQELQESLSKRVQSVITKY